MQNIPPRHAQAIIGEEKLVLLPGFWGVPGISLGAGTWWQPSEELGQCHPSPHGPFSHWDSAQVQPLALHRLGLPQQHHRQPVLLPCQEVVSGPE